LVENAGESRFDESDFDIDFDGRWIRLACEGLATAAVGR